MSGGERLEIAGVPDYVLLVRLLLDCFVQTRSINSGLKHCRVHARATQHVGYTEGPSVQATHTGHGVRGARAPSHGALGAAHGALGAAWGAAAPF